MFKLFLKRFFYYVDVTALDVFLGTLGLLFFIDFSLQADTVWFVYLLSIAVVIWLTYVADHIIDSNLFKQKLLPRHSFFRNNKTAIYCFIVFICLVFLLLIFLLDNEFLIQYGALAIVILICRWAFRKFAWLHTITIALGYSIGVFSPFIYFKEFNLLELSGWMLYLLVFTFSLANIFVINFLEKEEDKKEKEITIFNTKENNINYKYLVFILLAITGILALTLRQCAGFYVFASIISVFTFGYFKNNTNKKYLKPLVELSLGLPFLFTFLNYSFTCI